MGPPGPRDKGIVTMRGVIIWYSEQDQRAVIWCEDSADLAIATDASAWRKGDAPVEIGDYVGFTSVITNSGRRCDDIHLIQSQVAPELVQRLRQSLPQAPRPTMKVVSSQGRPAHAPRPAQIRSGSIPLLHLAASQD